MNAQKYRKYSEAQLAAWAAAIEAAALAAKDFEDEDDGGTCNFDSAFLRAPGLSEEQAEELAKRSGVGNFLDNHSLYGPSCTCT